MPEHSDRKPRREPVRTDRERALVLIVILAVFIAAYLILIYLIGPRGLDPLEPLLPSLGLAMIGIGITVLVTTFSFVFVALSLVSVQFSPRVVRHFWHGDRFRLIFLWSFIGIFGFLFVTLFVPRPRLQLLAVTLGAYAVFVIFPAFLSYLADNLNAASITNNIANRTLAEISREYYPLPDRGHETGGGNIVRSRGSGFLEHIDTHRLAAVFKTIRNENPEAVLRSKNYLGSFIEVSSPLAVVEPGMELDDEIRNEIRWCFVLRKFRSLDQDVEYGIRQLVDIGVKAISPAVNDPTTCVNCIHYIGVIIKELIGHEPRTIKAAELEKAGIVLKEPSFEQFVDDAFDQIYQFGRKDHVIVRTIISVLTEIMAAASDPERAEVVAKEIVEMELSSLYDAEGSSPFPLVENRNYLRKTLANFYRTAEAKFISFDQFELAAEYRRLAERIDKSLGI